MKEKQTVLSEAGKDSLSKIDYSDTFSTTNHVNTIEEITYLIFNTKPYWMKFLYAMRNKIAPIFGLKRNIPKNYFEAYEVGGYIKSFKFFSITDKEVIIGADDAHLNFRLVVGDQKSDIFNINLTTLVEYKNHKGKIYMDIIKPFHKLVIKRMLQSAFAITKV